MDFEHIAMLAGGLGLFLYGMHLMGDGLEVAAGNRLRSLLNVLTRNRFLAILVGFLFTAIVQSSSATTVMVVGFVNAGLMDLMQAAGVIMGANIGTTVTGQLIAFKLDQAAPLILLAGIVMMLFLKKKKATEFGQIIAGFGILFVGLSMMSESMEPLRYDEGVRELFVSVGSNPFLCILVGFVVTMIIQSSSASIGILQALAMQGDLIPLEGALFVLIGTNIGTCITAMLSSVGTNKNARSAAVIHLLFNCFGAVLMYAMFSLPCVPWVSNGQFQMVYFKDMLNQIHPGDMSRQIAMANTIAKTLSVLVMVGFTKYLVKLSQLLVPGKAEKPAEDKLRYLDERILLTPPVAVAQAQREVQRMGALALKNLELSIEYFNQMNDDLIADMAQREQCIDTLNHEITKYLVLINGLDITETDRRLIGSLFHVVTDIERIGDHAENIYELGIERKNTHTEFSENAQRELSEMCTCSTEIVRESLIVFETGNREKLAEIEALEQRIDDMQERLHKEHIRRLNEAHCTPQSGAIFLEAVNNLERVGDHACNISDSVTER